jgi:hypothetical protein
MADPKVVLRVSSREGSLREVPMQMRHSKKHWQGWPLILVFLASVAFALAAQEAPSATFVNETDSPIFLKVHLTDEPSLCAEGEYVTYEIAAGEEVTVEFGDSQSACYCALAVPRDTCEFPETTQPGETVVLEGVEGESESS